MKRVLRAMAFVAKEIADVVRQPRLLVTLVVGPFAILAAFGVSLADALPEFRTVFVAPAGSEVERSIERYGPQFANYVTFVGVTPDEGEALRSLREGEVDVVAIMPDDPLSYLQRDRRAVIVVLHDSVDPIVAAAVEGAARLAADEINREILATFVTTGQRTGDQLQEVLPALRRALALGSSAIESGDRARAEAVLGTTSDQLRRVYDDAGVTALAVGLQPDPGRPTTDLRAVLDEVRRGAAVDDATRLEQLRDTDRALAQLEERLAAFASVRPEVVIRPFTAHTRSLAPIGTATAFYLPSILALLVQHLGVTFAALSMVRERELGTIELFSVAPVSAGEILLGKCTAYAVLGIGLMGILVAGLAATIGLPSGGDPAQAALVGVLVLLASIGVGMLIAIVSRSDTQAVQLSMLTLLSSFFFSGFFLSNGRLGQPASLLGAILPATHGTTLSRDILLRGRALDVAALAPLALIVVVSLGVAWWALRLQLRRR